MNIILHILAASAPINPSDIGITSPAKDANAALSGILNLAYSAAGIVAVLVIIYGAYIYMTSDGNAANVKRGRDAVVGAAVGIVIILMAFVITQFILGRF